MGKIWLGDLMRAKIKELGWSNAELARRVGVSPTHIGNLLRNIAPGTKSGQIRRIPLETIDKIAAQLSIPADLAHRAGGWIVEGATIGPEESQLLTYFAGLPADRRADAIALIEALWRRYRQTDDAPHNHESISSTDPLDKSTSNRGNDEATSDIQNKRAPRTPHSNEEDMEDTFRSLDDSLLLSVNEETWMRRRSHGGNVSENGQLGEDAEKDLADVERAIAEDLAKRRKK
jgi:transcriptional regulator with XRE-family HTH domain